MMDLADYVYGLGMVDDHLAVDDEPEVVDPIDFDGEPAFWDVFG